MIRAESATDKEGLAIMVEAVQNLTLLFALAGLSILGEAVEVVEDLTIQTLCTDGRKIFYSPGWMRKLRERPPVYLVFDVLHEWLHIFMNHVARRGDRDPKLWNIACDMWVVAECCRILSRPGKPVTPPTDGVIPPSWSDGLTVEDIYDKLKQNPNLVPPPPGGDPGNGSAKPGGEINSSADFRYESAQEYSQQEEDTFHQKFVEELQAAQAIMEQIQKGDPSAYGDAVRSRMQELTEGRVPWGILLRGDLLTQMGQEFATYSRPKRRYYPLILLPSYHSYKERVLLIAVDISASVGDTLLRAFISNIMPAAHRAEKCVVVTFDAVVREEVHTRRPAHILKKLKFMQGFHGGTSVAPVFDVVDRVNPTAIVVLTDGWITLPEKKYPNTLWVLPENGGEQPWGRNYKMAVSW